MSASQYVVALKMAIASATTINSQHSSFSLCNFYEMNDQMFRFFFFIHPKFIANAVSHWDFYFMGLLNVLCNKDDTIMWKCCTQRRKKEKEKETTFRWIWCLVFGRLFSFLFWYQIYICSNLQINEMLSIELDDSVAIEKLLYQMYSNRMCFILLVLKITFRLSIWLPIKFTA